MSSARITAESHKAPYAALRQATQGEMALGNTFGLLLREKARWQIASILLGTGLLLTTATTCYVAVRGPQITPFVVKVDDLGDERVVPLLTEPLTAAPSQIQSVLVTWLEAVRSISSDPAVFGVNWRTVEAYSTQATYARLTEYLQEQWQRQRTGARVAITVGNILPLGATQVRSYQIDWTEESYNSLGTIIQEESGAWRGVFKVADFQSALVQQEVSLRRQQKNYRNVLGIFVEEVSWQARPMAMKGEGK